MRKVFIGNAKGPEGKTPRKGVDYWTQEEIQSVVDEVLSKVGGSGNVSQEQIEEVVRAYLENNPPHESDPNVPDWAKQAEKPSYTASEVGARPSNWMPTASEVGALPSSTKIPSKLSDLATDSSHRYVSDSEKVQWSKKSIVRLWTGESDTTEEISLPVDCIRASYGDIFNIGRVLLIVNGYYNKRTPEYRKMIPYSTPSGADTYTECIEHNMSTILGINIGKTDNYSDGRDFSPGFGLNKKEYTAGQKVGHYLAYSATDFAPATVRGQNSAVIASIVFRYGSEMASLKVWSDGESFDLDKFIITEVLAIC